MNGTRLGDSLTKRMTLRLTDRQYEHVCHMAGVIDCTPSDYIRLLINGALFQIEEGKNIYEEKEKGGTSGENVTTHKHSKL